MCINNIFAFLQQISKKKSRPGTAGPDQKFGPVLILLRDPDWWSRFKLVRSLVKFLGHNIFDPVRGPKSPSKKIDLKMILCKKNIVKTISNEFHWFVECWICFDVYVNAYWVLSTIFQCWKLILWLINYEQLHELWIMLWKIIPEVAK